MRYIKVEFTHGNEGFGYQEVYQGRVVRLTDESGATISEEHKLEYHVVDDEPVQPEWALPDPVVDQPATPEEPPVE